MSLKTKVLDWLRDFPEHPDEPNGPVCTVQAAYRVFGSPLEVVLDDLVEDGKVTVQFDRGTPCIFLA